MEPTHHYHLTVSYDGRDYFGWQRLKDHPTLQAAFETAVEAATSERVPVRAAGRTDRGAHAQGQAIGFALAADIAPEDLVARVAEVLPPGLGVHWARRVPAEFHVRTEAFSKDYAYRIVNGPELAPELVGQVWHLTSPLDVEAMKACVTPLVGEHDFATFATKPRFKQRSTVCAMTRVEVTSDDDLLTLHFSADRFMMHMVRNLVRAIVKVGEGRFKPDEMGALLAAKSRAAAPGSAPAHGLSLMAVHYPPLAGSRNS